MRLRIKYCKVDLIDEVNASGRSTLTKRRIQQALARALAKYKFSEGYFKLKHVKLNLGTINNDHFEFEFYKKLELACEQFARKLLQEQQTETWIRASKERKSISDATNKEINKDQFDRLLRVLERCEEFPDREQLIRAYFEMYLEEMPEVLQAMLAELLHDVHETIPEIAKAHGSSELFESLDYLLDLLNEADPNSNWLERVKAQYEQRYGEKMPEHLARILMRAIEDETKHVDGSFSESELETLDEVSQENTGTLPNLTDRETKNQPANSGEAKRIHNTYAFILQWLEENAPLGNWLNRLQRNYRAVFDEAMSQEASELLHTFNIEHTLTFDADRVKLALCERIEKALGGKTENKGNRGAKKSSVYMGSFSSAVSKKDVVVPKNLHRQLETGVEFCNQWLSNKVLTATWISELKIDFKAQFGQNLPSEIANVLMKNSALEPLDPTPRIKNELVAKIVEAGTRQNNKTTGDQKEMKYYSFLIAWITSHELIGAWIEAVRTDFQIEFGTELPIEFATILESCTSVSESDVLAPNTAEVLENLLEEALPTKEPQQNKPTSESAKYLSFLLTWITSHELIGAWMEAVKTDFQAEFETKLPAQFAAILESFTAVSESDVLTANATYVLENLLQEVLPTKEPQQNKSTSESAKHLSFLLTWITGHELIGAWIEAVKADFQAEFGMELPAQFAAILESFASVSESDVLTANATYVLENLLQEVLPTTESEQTKFNSESAKHLFFLLTWITGHELIGAWMEAVKTDFQAEFETKLPAQFASILESCTSVSESDGSAANATTMLQNLLEEVLPTKEPQQNKSTSESAKHLSFLLTWITGHELSGAWMEAVKTDFQTEFETKLPAQFAAILESFTSVSESDVLTANAMYVLENLLQEVLPTKEPQQNKSTSESAKHLSFLLTWITGHELSGAWMEAVKADFQIEFGTELPAQFASILESFTSVSESDGSAANATTMLQNLLEEVLPTTESEQTKFNSESAKHLFFLLTWITGHELIGAWMEAVKTDFQIEFETELPIEFATILESCTSVSEPDGSAANATTVLENLLEEVLPTKEPQQNKSTSESAKYLSFLLTWITSHELIGAWMEAVKTDFQTEFETKLPAQFAAILESFTSVSEPDGSAANATTMLQNLLEEVLQTKEPQQTKFASESAKHLSFLLIWITGHELSGAWIEVVKADFQIEFGTELPAQFAAILESFTSGTESDGPAPNMAEVLENLLEEVLPTKEPEQTKVASESAKYLSFLLTWITSHELIGAWMEAVKTDFQTEFETKLPAQFAAILESCTSGTESDGSAANATTVLENLLEEVLPTKEPQQNKSTSESAKHLSFLLTWITGHELIGAWMEAVRTDFQIEFGTELPIEFATILESCTSVSEPDGRAANATTMLENLLEEVLQTTESEQTKFNSESAKHLSFLIAWITGHELIGAWIEVVKTDFQIEFETKLPAQFAAILESCTSGTESDGRAANATTVLENLLEEVLPTKEPQQTKFNSESAKHLSFLLTWITGHELSGAWIEAVKTDFQTEFETKLPAQFAAILESFTSVNESDGPALNMAEVLENLLEEVLPTKEPQQNKSSSESTKHLSFLLTWITEHELSGAWIEVVKTDFQTEFETKLPAQFAAILESFTSVNESDGPAPNMAEVLENLLEEVLPTKEPEQTKVASESAKHLSFLLIWITGHELSGAWIEAVKADFQAEFGMELPAQFAAILESFTSVNESDGPAPNMAEVLENLLEEVLPTKEPEQTKVASESAKHLSFLLTWITGHELSGAWIEAVKTDFQIEFGTELPAYLLAVFVEFQAHEVLKAKAQKSAELIAGLSEYMLEAEGKPIELSSDSMDQYDEVLREPSFFLDVIKKRFPKTVRQPFKEWADWISSMPAALTWRQCLQGIEQMHREIHGRELSLSKRLKFLELMIVQGDDGIFKLKEDAWFRSRVSEFLAKKKEQGDRHSEVVPKLEQVLDLLFAPPFDENWFDEVKKNYRVKLGKRMPTGLQVFLFETRKSILLQANYAEVRTKHVKTLCEAVLERFSAPSFKDVQRVLEHVEFSTEWLLVLAGMFESSEKKELPLPILQQLFQFSTDRPEWELADIHAQRRSLIEETVRKHFIRNNKASGERSRQAFFAFLAEELDQLPLDKNWKKVLSERYTAKMGHAFPMVFNRLLDELHVVISGDNDLEIPGNKSLNQLRREFDEFARERSMNDNLRELINLFRSLNRQHEDGWFSAVLSAYSNKFGRSTPIEVQKILLDFAAQQTLRSQQAESAEIKHYLHLLNAQVHAEMESNATLQQERDEAYLHELIDWVDAQMALNPSFFSLKEAYENTFKRDLPSWVRALLLDRSPRYTTEKKTENNILARQEVGSIQPKRMMKRTKRTSVVSDSARILKLRKQLEAMKHKREVDSEIILDAGIPVGWIFWKKCFDRFGWLQEGRFYEKEGFNTALLAVNWLTRLGTRAYGQELHPLMMRICELSAEEASYLDDDVVENTMNGEKLRESIANYYQEIMNIWQIVKVEELAELMHLFIRREGVLTQTFAGWDLAIVEEHYDVLMRKSPIPWPMTVIRFPWTSQTFNVEWG